MQNLNLFSTGRLENRAPFDDTQAEPIRGSVDENMTRVSIFV